MFVGECVCVCYTLAFDVHVPDEEELPLAACIIIPPVRACLWIACDLAL